MTKKIVISGLLGGLIFMLWTFVVNGVLGFKSSIDMKRLPNEQKVYEVLKEEVTEPGRYGVNPQIVEQRFPEGEPAFSVLYGGVGHEAAGSQMLIQLPLFFLIPLLAAWLLSKSSIPILFSYWKKVFFFSGIGLVVGLYANLRSFGIADYPFSDAVILALHTLALWTAIGMAVAWKLKPSE